METLPRKSSFSSSSQPFRWNLFFDSENRVRLMWRILIFLSIFIALQIFFGSIGYSLAGSFNRADIRTVIFINGLFSLAAALMASWITGRYCEHLAISNLGLAVDSRTLRYVGLGFLYGSLVFCLTVGLAIPFSSLSYVLNSEWNVPSALSSMLLAALFLSAPAAFEEVLFRGYLFQTLVRARKTIFGVVLTSALFATLHSMNPNVTEIAILNTFLAGVWFATAYLISKNLWFPIAIHFAWNWTQVVIFGAELSGFGSFVSTPFLKEIDKGPAWITGGDYGNEGGLACTAAMLAAISVNSFLLVRAARRRSRSSKPSES